uniref:TetR/AcrR family transcriptional regulator n=1 Tax=Parerythrobacter lutipelagi TaxID=1964208 RepID=UPI0010F4C93E|nr:TetR/AcrR family transcriptional regulator [Parerythrobacter lutipelagi]
MSSRESKRTGRPADEAKRLAVVSAAAHSFFAHGFAATSIEQVAADAQVSKVTIYNRFGDKRGLFAAAVEHECETMRGSLEVPAAVGGSLRDRMLAIGEAMGAFLSRPQMIQFERRIAAETQHDPEIGAAFLAAGPHRMKRAFAAYLAALTDAGELRVTDTELAAEQFVAMCKGMGDLERRFGHPVDPARDRERLEGAVEVFLKAYAADRSDR